jgi:hypothetical protein
MCYEGDVMGIRNQEILVVECKFVNRTCLFLRLFFFMAGPAIRTNKRGEKKKVLSPW